MRVASALRWAARIASAAFIVFLFLFSLDTLEEGLTRAFFIHNVPVLVLALLTAAAWKWPLVGSLTYSTAALWYGATVVRLVTASRLTRSVALGWYAVIGVPALCIATLFLLDLRGRSPDPD